MPSRRVVVVTVLVAATGVLAATGLLGLPGGAASRVLLPWQRRVAPDAGDERPALAIQEELARLTAENAVLRQRLGEYDSIRGEGHIPPQAVVLVRTRVVSLSQRAGRRFAEFDAGAVDGVLRGMAVCSGWSLVGTVSGTQEGRCLVQLVTDAESRIPAAVFNGQQRLAEGVLAGTGSHDGCELQFVEDRDGLDIPVGATVVTAAGDRRFPAGLVLGAVAEAQRPVGLARSGRAGGAGHWLIRVRPLRIAEELESALIMRFEGGRG